eukprot:gb/GFBE01016928.1/.p1 GENE.gb/GFBE01016928.1/~~gb/GFBE01016928.1/.p1  ORF type:complete len:444 (+),score=108.10 gb/GFBE01016928.1/:1-1332(+)
MSDGKKHVRSAWNKYEERTRSSHAYHFMDRTLTFFVSAFSFVSWTSWYNFCHTFGAFGTLNRLLVLTAVILAVLVLLIVLHFRHKRTLKAAAEMESDAGILDAKMAAALVEKTFGNITDAMGYVLVEAWTTVYALPNGGLRKDSVSFIAAVFAVGLFTFLLEVIERSLPRGSTLREVLDLAGQVALSACSWFITDPMVAMFKQLFNINYNAPPPFSVGMLAAAGSVLVLMSVNLLLANVLSYKVAEREDSESDGEDDDTADVIFLEKVMFLLKQASIYTTGRLFKESIIATDYAHNHPGWTAVLFIIFSVLALLVAEAVSNSQPLPDDPWTKLFWLKIRGDTLSLYMRAAGWISAVLLNTDLNWRASERRGNIKDAVVSQLIALAIDQFRVHRLASSLATEAEWRDAVAQKIRQLGGIAGLLSPAQRGLCKTADASSYHQMNC